MYRVNSFTLSVNGIIYQYGGIISDKPLVYTDIIDTVCVDGNRICGFLPTDVGLCKVYQSTVYKNAPLVLIALTDRNGNNCFKVYKSAMCRFTSVNRLCKFDEQPIFTMNGVSHDDLKINYNAYLHIVYKGVTVFSCSFN